MNMISLLWVFTATAFTTVANGADDTATSVKLVTDAGFSGPGSAFHLKAHTGTGSWLNVASDDFWLAFDATCPVCDVICREHGDFHAGGTYTIVESQGEVMFHADCSGDESKLSQCKITADRRTVAVYSVGLQCFKLQSVDQVYSTWFILGTVLLGVLTLLMLAVCVWYYRRGSKTRTKTVVSSGPDPDPAGRRNQGFEDDGRSPDAGPVHHDAVQAGAVEEQRPTKSEPACATPTPERSADSV